MFLFSINPFSANFTKWSNTLTQFVGTLPTNYVSVFDHFVRLALKGLTHIFPYLLTQSIFLSGTPWKYQEKFSDVFRESQIGALAEHGLNDGFLELIYLTFFVLKSNLELALSITSKVSEVRILWSLILVQFDFCAKLRLAVKSWSLSFLRKASVSRRHERSWLVTFYSLFWKIDLRKWRKDLHRCACVRVCVRVCVWKEVG